MKKRTKVWLMIATSLILVGCILAKLFMLNLHATFTKGTVEFRLFQFEAPTAERRNGLHAGQLKSYIQLCLALSQMAKTVKTASPKPQQNDNPKYAMPDFMAGLACLDSFSSLQGRGDAGPEGEEGQDLGGQPAPGWYFKGATGGLEQPGQQPPAQPQA